MQLVKNWAINERWNPGLYEVDALYAADPNVYYLLEMDKEPVASLASVRYSKKHAFLGLYIVEPHYRGQGYGKLLWDIVMGNLKDCSSIGLNGVSEQLDQYKKEGFNVAHTNTRWHGNLSSSKNPSSVEDTRIKLKKPVSLSAIIDYDARLFPTPRAAFLSKWLTMPHSHVFAAIDNGDLSGYGVISKAHDGYKIAPLVANNQAVAKCLYINLCRCIGSQDSVSD